MAIFAIVCALARIASQPKARVSALKRRFFIFDECRLIVVRHPRRVASV
jgi:hypothetical protein